MSVLSVRGLTKRYGDTLAAEDLSFDVERGEVFGFLGPNGAGKTTTIRTMLGFHAPTAGTAELFGHDVREEGELLRAKPELGYLPGSPAFDGDVTGRGYLDFHARLKGDERREELLDLFSPPLDRRIREYSTGNKQMLGLVQAFMHDPTLVVMDEPTSGLDPLKQETFLEFVRTEREQGTTFFFSSHVLSEVRKVCDRVGIIRNGRLVEVASVGSLLDRSGKHVRLTVAGSVDGEAFDLPGAHNVTVGGGSRERSGADRDGVTAVSFTYTGAYEPLLRRLLEHEIRELSIEEAPLEDVFMRFYDEDRVVDDAGAAGGVDAESDDAEDGDA